MHRNQCPLYNLGIVMYNPKHLLNSAKSGIISLGWTLIVWLSLPLASCLAQNGSWKAASPGFTPQTLLGHHDTMWATGSGGNIASSSDGGKTWILKHADSRDGLLLVLNFTTDKFGYAAGTGKRILLTEDGGESWNKVIEAPATVWQAAFGDSQHGVIRTREALMTTADGGKSWNPVTVINDPGWQEKYPHTTSMSAVDAAHMIIRVSEGKYSDGEYLWTGDGGATWNANYLPNGAGSDDVFTLDGAYWSIGGEAVGKDKPGGGGRIPMAVRSRDGITWEHLPVYYEACHWTGCGGCTPQGCFAGRSSFVPFSRILQENANTAESLATFPGHILSSHWARNAKTLCILTQGSIECTSLKNIAKLNTQDDLAEWSDESFPALHNSRPAMLGSTSIEPALKPGVHCIRCSLVNLYVSHEAKTGPAEIQINFTIGEDGGVRGFKVSGGIPKDVADKVKASALGWLFEPYEQNGKPKFVNVDIRGSVMIMNPDSH